MLRQVQFFALDPEALPYAPLSTDHEISYTALQLNDGALGNGSFTLLC